MFDCGDVLHGRMIVLCECNHTFVSCEVSRGKVQLCVCVCVRVCVRETVVEGYVGEADRGPCVPSTPDLWWPQDCLCSP